VQKCARTDEGVTTNEWHFRMVGSETNDVWRAGSAKIPPGDAYKWYEKELAKNAKNEWCVLEK
jgi:hypothetical protein